MPLVMDKFGLLQGEFLPELVRERYAEVFRAQVVRLTKIIEDTRAAMKSIDEDRGLNGRGKADRINALLNDVRPQLVRETINGTIQRSLADAAQSIPTAVIPGKIDAAQELRLREVRDVLREDDPAAAITTAKVVVNSLRAAAQSQLAASKQLEQAAERRDKAPADLKGALQGPVDAAAEKFRQASAAVEAVAATARDIIVALQTDPLRGVKGVVPEAEFITVRDEYLRIVESTKFDDLQAAKDAATTYKANAVRAAGELNIVLEQEYHTAA